MLSNENIVQVAKSNQTDEFSEPSYQEPNFEKTDETLFKSFDEELKSLEEQEAKPLGEQDKNIEEQYKNLLGQGNAQAALLASLFHNNFIVQKQEESLDLPEIKNIKDLSELKEFALTLNDSNEPIIDLNKEKLEISIHFPAVEEVQSVTVKYDPVTRSVVAEMLTSSEAAKVLQNQVAQLERNLAKHDIKLQSLKINSLSGNSGNQERQNPQDNQRRNKQKGS